MVKADRAALLADRVVAGGQVVLEDADLAVAYSHLRIMDALWWLLDLAQAFVCLTPVRVG